MCNSASFVIVSQGAGLVALWDKSVSESHEDIINHFNLKDDELPPDFVRVEINPPSMDGDGFSAPFEQWTFKTDQDVLPDWYDSERAEVKGRGELAAWLAAKVVLPGQKRAEVSDRDYVVAVFGTIQAVWGGTIQNVWGGIIEHVSGGTIQNVRGGVIQNVSGGIIEHVGGSATVISYIKIEPSILKSSLAVLIDRSGDEVVVYVGKDEHETRQEDRP